MSAEDRRAMIIDAVIPLLIEHGNNLTSRQIADEIGIAEGTIFRVFGDKDSLISAALDTYFDPEPLRQSLRAIDPSLSLEDKLRAIMGLLRNRFEGIFRMASFFGHRHPRNPPDRTMFAQIVADVLAEDDDRLNWPPERVAHIARLLAFASAFPQLNDGIEFSTDELTRVMMYGVIGVPADAGQQ